MRTDKTKRTIESIIKQRRAQLMMHSTAYYVFGDSLVSDDTFDRWAYELVELQKKKREIGFFDKLFKDWDGHTGMHIANTQFGASKYLKLRHLF